MKMYIGYEFNTTIPEYINLDKEQKLFCFMSYTLKQMQERINTFGCEDKDYSVYEINLTPKQITDLLDNLLSECSPPDENIKVKDLYIMAKGRKTPVPYNVWIKEKNQVTSP